MIPGANIIIGKACERALTELGDLSPSAGDLGGRAP